MQRGMLRGIAAFRWGAWGWMAAVLVVQRNDPQRERRQVGRDIRVAALLALALRRRLA
jgi:hypothetical protein